MEETRDRIIAVRVTEHEHAAIKDAADRDHRPIATFVRLVALREIAKEVSPSSTA